MQLNYRSAAHMRGPATVDEENRSLEFIVATESPVRMFDPATGGVVPEVLLANGCWSDNGKVHYSTRTTAAARPPSLVL
jgi:hypothetical protein